MNTRLKVFILILAVLSSRVWALTTEQAVKIALENNPDIQRLQAAAEAASWKRLATFSPNLPHLTLRGSNISDANYPLEGLHLGPLAYVLPGAYPTTTGDMDLTWTVFDGLSTFNAWRGSDLEYEAAELDYSSATFRLERQVKTCFYQALAAKELEEVAQRNVDTLQSHLDLAKANEDSGVATSFDVLRIEAQMEEARAEKDIATDNTMLARRTLNQTMGITEDTSPLEGELPLPPDHPRDYLAKTSDGPRDDIKASLKRKESADAQNLALAGSLLMPKVSLFLDEEYYKYTQVFDPAVIPLDWQRSYNWGLSLNWDIFDGGLTLARQQEVAARVKQAEQASRSLQLHAADDVELWKRQLVNSTTLYLARQRALAKSEESVRLATLGLKAGTRTHTEVLDAELDLFSTRANIIKAQLDAATALLNLEIALGKSLQ